MKRHIDRNLSPQMKRFRSFNSPEMDPYERYERIPMKDPYHHDLRDRLPGRRSLSPQDNYGHYDDERNRSSDGQYFRSLCARALPDEASDNVVRDVLFREFKRFGDFNIKITLFNGERVAYLNFKYPEHAEAARNGRMRVMLYDRPIRIEAVFRSNKQRRSPSPPKFRHEDSRDMSPFDLRDRLKKRPSSPRPYDVKDNGNRQKKDVKYPHHLVHIDPEDDPTATRTLFVGNLQPDVVVDEVRKIFETYGFVEDVDIKRPTKGSTNAYAFVRYLNLDMAHRAKVAMSGQYIRNFQCKIGYGKANPTCCVWVGGLGPWIEYDNLEREFIRFGPIVKIKWPPGKNYAYILYESNDCAIAACKHMRGYPLGGDDKRVRLDFAELEHIDNDPSVRRKNVGSGGGNRQSGGDNFHRSPRPVHDRSHASTSGDFRDYDGERHKRLQHHSPSNKTVARRLSPEKPLTIETARTVTDLSKCLESIWNGLFLLKNSRFGARMHMLRGEEQLVDQFMKRGGSEDLTKLKITQRMRLDPLKLDDVNQRIQAAGDSGFCVMLAMPTVTSNESSNSNDSKQTPRALKHLISYLRAKESAGVVFLNSTSSEESRYTGVLHAFPPCGFAYNLLMQRAGGLQRDYSKDDHLVVLLIRSSIV